MGLVLFLWYALKHWWLATRRTTGDTISRAPTSEDEPIGTWNGIKRIGAWNRMKRNDAWNRMKRVGVWSRMKRYLIKCWTAEIEQSEDVEAGIAPNGQLTMALRQSANPAVISASCFSRSSEDIDLTPINEGGEDRPGILVEEREERELKDPIPF